jgi:hypothetical protein
MFFNKITSLAILGFSLFAFAGCAEFKDDDRKKDGMPMVAYKGQCYCSLIQFSTKGEPLFTQHCHCNKCRAVAVDSKNPIDKKGYGFTAAYQTKNFEIINGKDKLISIVSNNSRLYLCSQCRSLIYGISEDPSKQEGIGINANNFQFNAGIPDSFIAVRHIWYQNRIVDVDDELPKFKDAPKEQFGTGELF